MNPPVKSFYGGRGWGQFRIEKELIIEKARFRAGGQERSVRRSLARRPSSTQKRVKHGKRGRGLNVYEQKKYNISPLKRPERREDKNLDEECNSIKKKRPQERATGGKKA